KDKKKGARSFTLVRNCTAHKLSKDKKKGARSFTLVRNCTAQKQGGDFGFLNISFYSSKKLYSTKTNQ
ncbi:hypothetical protein, partial [Mesomycoplasma ovipneumoniae]|uniref:hypothetical protein n=1 Tax=Mesomycoplasma ovipneumoniae TaxID=29562 RepID=UPI003B517873